MGKKFLIQNADETAVGDWLKCPAVLGRNVDPSPVTSTLGQGGGDQTRNTTGEQTQPTDRDPTPTGNEGIGSATAAQIRIVIRRPGGEQ